MEEALWSAAGSLIAGAVVTLFIMWRDIAILKRDVDGLAENIGTVRAKARRKKAED